MAASATINYNMRGSVGLEFGLPIVAFAVAENGLFNPSAMAASAGLLATLLDTDQPANVRPTPS